MGDKFHERFQIEISVEEARYRFINRAHNELLSQFSGVASGRVPWERLLMIVATKLGEPFWPSHASNGTLEVYTRREFHRTLQAIEAVREP